jgi:predicted transposase YbfD/YdcC
VIKGIIDFLGTVEDPRQWWKVDHILSDVVVTVLFGTLANANNWPEIAEWAKYNEELLKRFIKLEKGTASHDTIQRVMESIKPEKFQELTLVWRDLLNKDEGEKIKKILAIDGKTIRGNGNKNQNALHVVSAWSREDGVCFGQKSSDSKGKEIPMIKTLLDLVSVKGQIVTIDAIGTQKEIAKKIKEGKGDYVLAVKGNQPIMHEEIKEYFDDDTLLEECKRVGNYKKVTEKARGQIETREYWQTGDVKWFEDKAEWAGLMSFGMNKTTIKKSDGGESVEKRYFISSLKPNIDEFERAVRGHWSVESMHWHLDVLFKEDGNRTLSKTGAENLNIARKWALSLLKTLDMGKKHSLRMKRFILCSAFEQFISKIMAA